MSSAPPEDGPAGAPSVENPSVYQLYNAHLNITSDTSDTSSSGLSSTIQSPKNILYSSNNLPHTLDDLLAGMSVPDRAARRPLPRRPRCSSAPSIPVDLDLSDGETSISDSGSESPLCVELPPQPFIFEHTVTSVHAQVSLLSADIPSTPVGCYASGPGARRHATFLYDVDETTEDGSHPLAKQEFMNTWTSGICWTGPGSGELISFYELQLQEARLEGQGKDIHWFCSQTEEHLENLTPDTTYIIRVRALNVAGAGKWSAPYKFGTMPSIPGLPLDPCPVTVTVRRRKKPQKKTIFIPAP